MAVTGIRLSRTDENVAEIDALAARLGGRVGLEGVLARLDRRAARSLAGRLLGRAVDAAYRWDRTDARDPRWWPQGISSTADAQDAGTVSGRRLLLTTWYAKDLGDGSHGSRVTVLDLETRRYQHVLLVTPDAREGGPGIRPLRIHAGGVVWRGRWLHVAATARGFVTCHLDDVMPAGDEPGAHGHALVLPARFAYTAHTDEGHERLRYSFLSLDRSSDPPGLLAGEYGRGGSTTRLARFDLTGEGLLEVGDDGWSRPAWLDEGGVRQMQGAVLAAGRHYVTSSRGRRWPGSVHVGRPGRFREHRLAVPMGPEDVTWWPATDRLWSVTEHPGRRWVVSMRRSWFD